MSKSTPPPPLPPLSLSLRLSAGSKNSRRIIFFRAAASALSSLPPSPSRISPSPYLLLAPLWECSEGKRIIDTSSSPPPPHPATSTTDLSPQSGGLQADSSWMRTTVTGGESELGGRRRDLELLGLPLPRSRWWIAPDPDLVSGALSTSGLTAGRPTNRVAGRAWRAVALRERKKGKKKNLKYPTESRGAFLGKVG